MNFFECGLLLTVSKLQTYYDGISQIRKTFEIEHKNITKNNSGFKSSPTPNPCYNRTQQHLFLEKTTLINKEYMSQSGNTIENLRLFTPFGLVEMISNPNSKERHEQATNFLAHMDWDIVDVTDKIMIYTYAKEENKSYPQQPRKDIYRKFTIHLVTRIGSIQLVPKDSDINKLDLFYYNSVIGVDHEQENQLFNSVSGGKNCF